MREQVRRNWVRGHAVGIQVHRDLQREWKLWEDSPAPWLHTGYVWTHRRGCLGYDPLHHRCCMQTVRGLWFLCWEECRKVITRQRCQVTEGSWLEQAPLDVLTHPPPPPPLGKLWLPSSSCSVSPAHSAEKFSIMLTLKGKCLNKSCSSQNTYWKVYSLMRDK